MKTIAVIKDFETWVKKHEDDIELVCDAKKGWDARQQEIDDLKEQLQSAIDVINMVNKLAKEGLK